MNETDQPFASTGGPGPGPADELPTVHAVPRDPEEAQRALVEILDLLSRYEQFREQSRDQFREQARERVRERAREAIETTSADAGSGLEATRSAEQARAAAGATAGDRGPEGDRGGQGDQGDRGDRGDRGGPGDGRDRFGQGMSRDRRDQAPTAAAASGQRVAAEDGGVGGAGDVDRDEPFRDREPHDGAGAPPLTESQYLARLRARVDALHPADVAYVLEALPQEDRMLVWDSVKAEADGAILLEVSEPVRDSLIESMTHPELVAAARTLDADDLADLAADLPGEVVEEVRRQLTPEEREQLRAAMSYPEDTVGGRMDFDLVTVREDVTLEVVLRYLRRFDELPQHTDQVFVVDREDLLKGALPIDQLLINEPDTLVADVMRRDVLALHGLDEASEAAQAFERYDLVSAPVVDPHGHLIGRLTIDEVVDVIREQTEAEILSAAGLREEEDLFAPVLRSARNRGLWLALNLATAFFASRVIGLFEDTIERIVALAALMPIVAGIAGNSGNQTMTLVIRAIALGQVAGGNFGRLIRKELLVAALNGVMWGGIAGALTFLLYQGTAFAPRLALTMTAAMVLNLLVGALIGVLVPLAMERMGRDPAIGSSVLLTFSTDSLGFLIFLGLATIFFN